MTVADYLNRPRVRTTVHTSFRANSNRASLCYPVRVMVTIVNSICIASAIAAYAVHYGLSYAKWCTSTTFLVGCNVARSHKVVSLEVGEIGAQMWPNNNKGANIL